MKTPIAIALIIMCAALGAFAQGSLNGLQSVFSVDGIATGGPDATDPANPNINWFNGNVAVTFYYAPAASVTAYQIADINSFDGMAMGGVEALAALFNDGFTVVSTPELGGTSPGSLNYAVSDGYLTTGPDTITLLPPVPTGGSGWLAMDVMGLSDGYRYSQGVLAWWQGDLGGNPYTTPPGFPAPIVTDPAGLNLVLWVPEPGAVVLGTVGAASLLLLRRHQ
jgi:hypothetical protein